MKVLAAKEATVSDGFTVSDYLISRLTEIGITHIFGVPGDYNLAFLDHIVGNPELAWVGNANELNAAYAADGYARVAGAGALLTTYGVGELSAINGLAGSYAEYVPVIHIVGAPATSAQRAGSLKHHTLGDGDYHHFARAYAEVTVARAYLSADNAIAEIDRVLVTSLRERRPGYLVLPADVAASPADKPSYPLSATEPRPAARLIADFRSAARAMLSEAGSLAVLADFLADRFGVRRHVNDLITAGQIPHATLSMGKSLLDESDPGFVGIYSGVSSAKPVLAAIEEADVLISVGVRFNDATTTNFSQQTDPQRTIDVQPFATRIGDREFAPLPMRDAVRALSALVRELGRSWARPDLVHEPDDGPPESAELRQAQFWPTVQRFLRPGDIVLAEQGTAFFGAQDIRLPSEVSFIGQPLWGSIGYTLPAALGAQLAAPGRRTIVLIGDGSMQLTAQEVGTLLREGCDPVIIVLDNGGYTLERAIHGEDALYNDIARWNWELLPAAMGGESVMTATAGTLAEFTAALDKAADPAGRLVLIEARLPRLDVPEYAASLARAIRVSSPPSPVDEETVSPVHREPVHGEPVHGEPVRGGRS
jgi:indolepyruvate decarboxylase